MLGKLFDEVASFPGKLTEEDIADKLKSMGLPPSRARLVFKAAAPADAEFLSKEEFLVYASAKLPYLRFLFDDIDASSSGSINRHELKKALASLRLDPSEDDVRAMIASIDKPSGVDGVVPPNGKIEFHEFVDFMILVSPKGTFLDFSPLADDWLHASSVGLLSDGSSSSSDGSSGWSKALTAVNGGFASAFSRAVVAPLERLRMQLIVDGAKHSSTWGCFTSIFRNEGIKGYWRGNWINVLRIGPQGAVAFVAKDYYKQLFPSNSLGLAAASMAAGATCMVSIYPLDLVRGRITTTPGVYSGMFNGLATIAKKEGPLALYKGVGPAAVWAVPYYGAQFFTYDSLKKLYNKHVATDEASKAGPMVGLAMGAVAGGAGTTAAFPFELIRRQLQMQGIGGRPVLYSGVLEAGVGIVKNRGVLGLFDGLKANLIKSPLAAAVAFWSFETFNKVLNTYAPDHLK